MAECEKVWETFARPCQLFWKKSDKAEKVYNTFSEGCQLRSNDNLYRIRRIYSIRRMRMYYLKRRVRIVA